VGDAERRRGVTRDGRSCWPYPLTTPTARSERPAGGRVLEAAAAAARGKEGWRRRRRVWGGEGRGTGLRGRRAGHAARGAQGAASNTLGPFPEASHRRAAGGPQGARIAVGRGALPLPLGCPSAALRLPLGCPSAAPRLPLGCPSAALRLPLGCTSARVVVPLSFFACQVRFVDFNRGDSDGFVRFAAAGGAKAALEALAAGGEEVSGAMPQISRLISAKKRLIFG